MEKKYFIITVVEDLQNTILFDLTDKLKEQGHYFVVNCTSNRNQFDVKRVSKEEFNKFNNHEKN